jgi:hypothetical protein
MFNLEKIHIYDRKLALGRVLLVVLLVTSLLIFTTQIVNDNKNSLCKCSGE